jgi:hypothetical protein
MLLNDIYQNVKKLRQNLNHQEKKQQKSLSQIKFKKKDKLKLVHLQLLVKSKENLLKNNYLIHLNNFGLLVYKNMYLNIKGRQI